MEELPATEHVILIFNVLPNVRRHADWLKVKKAHRTPTRGYVSSRTSTIHPKNNWIVRRRPRAFHKPEKKFRARLVIPTDRKVAGILTARHTNHIKRASLTQTMNTCLKSSFSSRPGKLSIKKSEGESEATETTCRSGQSIIITSNRWC